MLKKKKIIEIVNDYFKETDKFLVDVKVSPQNKITVHVDGDNGVSVSDCVKISKHIEKFLDRDTIDFELEVSSADIGKPLRLIRQYHKNIGRALKVLTNDEKIKKGILSKVEEKGIEIALFSKDTGKKGSKKTSKNSTVSDDKKVFLNFEDIKEAKIEPKI